MKRGTDLVITEAETDGATKAIQGEKINTLKRKEERVEGIEEDRNDGKTKTTWGGKQIGVKASCIRENIKCRRTKKERMGKEKEKRRINRV